MTERALMPDYLRLIALFGIVVVNVQFMAFPMELGFDGASVQRPVDDVVVWLVNGLATLKTYGLFSFMFGVGLGFLIRSAERQGQPFATLYRNRMRGLALLGLLHGIFFFFGDILLIYAVMGFLLYRWRDWPVARLVKVGGILVIVQAVLASGIAFLPSGSETPIPALERSIMTEGSFWAVTGYRAVAFAFVFVLLVFVQGIAALGWFCLGLAAVRAGLIDVPGHPLWVKARRVCLLPGLALSLGAAAMTQWGDGYLGYALLTLTAPLATLGYLGLIAAIAVPPGHWGARLLKAGGASLTVYLGQSVVLSILFAPYGFGLWDSISPATAVALALGVTLCLILFLDLWLARARQGPFEWVLRRITYAGLPRTT